MAHLPTLVTDLALILVVAGVITLICKALKQPVIIGYILSGFLLGPVVNFFPTLGDTENINTLAEIGVIFMMFALGLEFNLKKMASTGVTAIVSAVTQVAGMVLLGYFSALLLGWGSLNGLFLGGMLGMSSTIITIKAIEDAGLRQEKFAGVAIGTLIIEDIAAIFLMLILATIAVSRDSGGGQLALSIGLLLLYLVLWLCLGVLLVPSLMKKLQPLLNDETLLVVALGICFGMVCLADAIGFSSALGAFMAGSILASASVSQKIEHMVTPLKDLFVAVFFVSVGLIVEPATIVDYIWPILILTVVTLVGKVLLLGFSMVATGQSLSTAVYGAFAQSQVGEFSFIIASLGLSLGVTGEFLYPVVVALAVITTFTTPILLKGAGAFERFLSRILPDRWVDFMARVEKEERTAEKHNHVWGDYLKKYFTTFALYGTIIGGIIYLGMRLLLPLALEQEWMDPTIDRLVVCAVIYLCMAPLIPPLLIFSRTNFTSLWLQNSGYHFPLVLLLGLRVVAAVVAIALPPVFLFDLPPFLPVLLALPAAFFAFRSQRLRGLYLQIAFRFLANLNGNELTEREQGRGWKGDEKVILVDEEIWVQESVYKEGSIASGKKLKDLDWGRKLDMNIIQIIRDGSRINAPTGSSLIYGGDRLVVMGRKKGVENFALLGKQRGFISRHNGPIVTLRAFLDGQACFEDCLQENSFTVEKGSLLENKSVREIDFSSRLGCILVGIERDRLPIIDPSASLVLREGDVLWVLGGRDTAARLRRQGIDAKLPDASCPKGESD